MSELSGTSFSVAAMYGGAIKSNKGSLAEGKSETFSMAALYGSSLGKADEAQVKSGSESAHLEEKKSGSDGVVDSPAQNDEDESQPLRVESIYNMALIQRPQTAIVTHGEERGQRNSESGVIDEEDECERWTSGSAERSAEVHADVWIADEDGPSPNVSAASFDDSVVNESSRLSNDDKDGTVERLAASYARFSASPNQKGDPVVAAALGRGGRSLERNLFSSPTSQPSHSPARPMSGASSSSSFSSSSSSTLTVADVVAPRLTHFGPVRTVWASSMGHLAERCLNDDPDDCWISSGLFPQVLVLTFGHDMAVDAVEIDACGVPELDVVLSSQGPGGEVALGPCASSSSSSSSASSGAAHSWSPAPRASHAAVVEFEQTGGTGREQKHVDLRNRGGLAGHSLSPQAKPQHRTSQLHDSGRGERREGEEKDGEKHAQPVLCRSLSLVATRGTLDFFAVFSVRVHGSPRVYENW